MCGRFASFRDAQALADEFALAEIAQDARLLPPSWNVAPTDPVRIVVERNSSRDGRVIRSLRVARWGLIPSWSKDSRDGARMINARAESLPERRSFAGPLSSRRCLVVADGYYEWSAQAPGPTQPYFMSSSDTLAFAGLYEFWRDPHRADDDPAHWLVSTTIVTTTPSEDLAPIHDRMPLVLPRGTWDVWLDPTVGSQEAAGLLTTRPEPLTAVPVSRAVGSVAANGPDLVLPVGPGTSA